MLIMWWARWKYFNSNILKIASTTCINICLYVDIYIYIYIESLPLFIFICIYLILSLALINRKYKVLLAFLVRECYFHRVIKPRIEGFLFRAIRSNGKRFEMLSIHQNIWMAGGHKTSDVPLKMSIGTKKVYNVCKLVDGWIELLARIVCSLRSTSSEEMSARQTMTRK